MTAPDFKSALGLNLPDTSKYYVESPVEAHFPSRMIETGHSISSLHCGPFVRAEQMQNM